MIPNKLISFIQKRNNRTSLLICLIISLITISSCKIYRFTDAAVDPNLKTFSVNPTINIATLQNPNAAPVFTDKLKDKFLRETRMALSRDNGDVEFSATIIEYNVDPVTITGTETLAQNRLNISVQVEYVNRKDEKKNFKQVFRDGENYDANKQLINEESALINSIFDRILQQIFNKTFGNW
ncbi:MAG: LptE family protein [Chitinophagales bacterium]